MSARMLLLVLTSAVGLPLALPNDLAPLGNPILGLVCLVPLFAALLQAKNLRQAGLLGALFGGLSSFGGHYWLLFFGEFSLWTVGGVVLAYTGLLALAMVILKGVITRAPIGTPFLIAAGWTVWEFMKSRGFLGFPWGLLPHTFGRFLPALQIAEITGIWGISFAAAFVNASIAVTLIPQRGGKRQGVVSLGFAAVLAGAIVLFGFARTLYEPEVDGTLSVVLVQHNADPWRQDQEYEAVARAEALTREALASTDPELIIWSETVIPRLLREADVPRFIESYPPDDPIGDLLAEYNTPLLVGSPLQPEGTVGYQNAALLLSPEGRLVQHYGKQHLVPFAERVPFWRVPAVRTFFESALGLTEGWAPGKDPTVFSLQTRAKGVVRFGVPICFEDSFPSINREFMGQGADLLVNLTNVSWSRRESAMMQMLAAARFRSIENRVALVRGTNGGVTSVIGWHGDVIAYTDLFEPRWLYVEVPLYRGAGQTAYSRYGDVFPLALGLLLFAAVILPNRRDPRSS